MSLLWVPSNLVGGAMCVANTRMRAIVFAFFITGNEAPAFAGGPAGGCCVGGRWQSVHRFTRLRKLNIVGVDNVRPVGRQPCRVEGRPSSLVFLDGFNTKCNAPRVLHGGVGKVFTDIVPTRSIKGAFTLALKPDAMHLL